MAELKFDVVIIGSGPAGNTAAIYLSRSKMSVAVISGMTVGGQLTITTEVENFPGFKNPILGTDLMQNMLDQSQRLGANIIYDTVKSVDFSMHPYKCYTESGDVYISTSVIIATGASPRWLDLPEEQKFIGRGLSACATCDGSFFKNKDVAVVGGGSSAGVEAIHLSHLCSKVYLIHRRDTFRMKEEILERVKSIKNIEFILDTNVIAILSNQEQISVSGVRIKNAKTRQESEINLSAVFLAIGRKPSVDLFKDTGLEFDENDYIITRPDSSRTSLKYVYAIGDVANKPFKQAVIAAGYGATASLEVKDDMQK